MSKKSRKNKNSKKMKRQEKHLARIKKQQERKANKAVETFKKDVEMTVKSYLIPINQVGRKKINVKALISKVEKQAYTRIAQEGTILERARAKNILGIELTNEENELIEKIKKEKALKKLKSMWGKIA